MASLWIKIDRDLPHKPEVMRMAELLGVDELQVVGHLVLFWSWCDANMSLDCPDVIGTKRGLNRAACHDGMVDALIEVGWLEVIRDGAAERYRIPKFERHLSKSAKTRVIEQQKKQRQRKCPDAKGTNVPTAQGTSSGPEKIREEKSNNIEGRAPEYRIPASLDDTLCRAAAERWFDYLDSKNLQDKSPRGNEIQLESWWQEMAKLGHDNFLAAVTQSIAAGRWNVELKEQQNGRARKEESQGWVLAVKVAKAHPTDWKKREELLPADVLEALKKTGSRAVAEGNSYELKTLKDIFESHLKDIRSGITASN